MNASSQNSKRNSRNSNPWSIMLNATTKYSKKPENKLTSVLLSQYAEKDSDLSFQTYLIIVCGVGGKKACHTADLLHNFAFNSSTRSASPGTHK